MGSDLRAEPDDEPPAGRARQIPADIGDCHRCARKGDRDAGVQFDAFGRSSRHRQRQKRVVLVLHRGDAVVSLGLDRLCSRPDLAQILLRQRCEYAHRSAPLGYTAREDRATTPTPSARPSPNCSTGSVQGLAAYGATPTVQASSPAATARRQAEPSAYWRAGLPTRAATSAKDDCIAPLRRDVIARR